MQSTKAMRGARVMGGKKNNRKYGKVGRAVFHPSELRVVGFIVKRPDLLLMFKRPDRFLAVDGFDVLGGRICPVKDPRAWDAEACKHLGVVYEECVVWEGMDIRTRDGKVLGAVADVTFDPKDGRIGKVVASEGGLARALLGTLELPVDVLCGYEDGAIVVDSEAAEISLSGGLAAKAGEATAKAGAKIASAGTKAGEKTKKAVHESASAWGEMFKDTKAAFDEAVGDNGGGGSGDAAKSAAAKVSAKEGDESDGELARKLGRQLHKAGGMFSAFREEYKKEASGK